MIFLSQGNDRYDLRAGGVDYLNLTPWDAGTVRVATIAGFGARDEIDYGPERGSIVDNRTLSNGIYTGTLSVAYENGSRTLLTFVRE